MAVTAKFLADFASFHDAVEKAEVQLKGMETGANKVGTSLNRMVDSLSGRKLVQDATLAAAAVERIGGTSKLTASELSRVQAQATAAAEKLRAMGQTVPPGIQKIADTVKTTGSALDSMKGVVGTLAGAFGVAFSIGAVVNFGKQVFASASNIHDLAIQLGISTDAVQGFKHAAEQSGSSLDTVGTAITKMNQNLAGGDKATVQALKDAGLQFDAIRSMRPEDAFLTIADAIKGIPDPMTQSDVALQIFGRSAAELLPGMKEGFRQLAAAADKMSEDTINSLEAAEDAWDRLSNKVTIVTGTMIGHALNASERITRSFTHFTQFVENALKVGAGAAFAMADAQETASKAAAKNRDVHLTLEPVIKQTEAAVTKTKKAFQEKAVAVAENTHILGLWQKAMGHLAAQQQFEESAFRATTRAAEDYIKALPSAIFQTTSLAGAMAQVSEEAASFQGSLAKIATATTGAKGGGGGLFASLFGDSKDFGAQLSGTILGALKGGGNVAGAAAGMIGQSITTGIAKTITSGAGLAISGALGGAINAILPGVGALMGPLVEKIIGAFDRNKGRDIVTDFAKGFEGGFDGLHKELNALGDEGERLWIKLTQGVGRNNKDQARAAVDEVTAALEKHKTAQKDVTAAVLEADAAQVKAYEKAKEAVTTLDREIQTLSDSIAGEAPEEFMGIVEQQTRARIAALEKERDAASDTLEGLTGTMTDSIDKVREAIENLPEKIRLELEVHTKTPGFAQGGRVLPFAHGGRVPSGSDTVPAMLTPGEIVLNAAQQRNVAGSLGGNITINVNGAGNPDAVADAIMRKLRREKRLNVA